MDHSCLRCTEFDELMSYLLDDLLRTSNLYRIFYNLHYRIRHIDYSIRHLHMPLKIVHFSIITKHCAVDNLPDFQTTIPISIIDKT